MFTEKAFVKRSSSKINNKFINIESYSGYSLKFSDPEAPEFLFDITVSNEDLGKAVLESLKNSRFLELEKAYELEEICQENYPKWIAGLMERYGYKTKRALFKDMNSCDIVLRDQTIVIEPCHHETLEGWGSGKITAKDYVHVPFDAPPAEIGAALRLGFSRCTSKF
jgi:hypothetical protein